MPSDVKQQLFTVQQAATILARSTASIWRDCKAGRLTRVEIGGSTRISGQSIDRVLAGDGPKRPPRDAEVRAKISEGVRATLARKKAALASKHAVRKRAKLKEPAE